MLMSNMPSLDADSFSMTSVFFGDLLLLGNTLCMALYVIIQKRMIFYNKLLVDSKPENQCETISWKLEKTLNIFDKYLCRQIEIQPNEVSAHAPGAKVLVALFSDWAAYPITTTAWSYVFGAALMGAVSLYYAITDFSVFTSIDLKSMLPPLCYAVLITSTLCYGGLSLGNKFLSSTLITAFWPFQVFIAVMLSFIIFGDVLNMIQWIGAGFILLGLISVSAGDYGVNRKKSSPEPEVPDVEMQPTDPLPEVQTEVEPSK
jgi:drug/metabolite transporter (DMT)-like permease